MARNLPGSEPCEGREFVYIEAPLNYNISTLMDEVIETCAKELLPSSGGMLEERASITLPNGTALLGVSFKGDLVGWWHLIRCSCSARNRIWATILGQKLLLSNGVEIPIVDCKVKIDR